jgi:hypothetical protein
VFHSVVSLQAAINRFGAEANADPRPFRWTEDPDKIIAAVRRGHQALDSLHQLNTTSLPQSLVSALAKLQFIGRSEVVHFVARHQLQHEDRGGDDLCRL